MNYSIQHSHLAVVSVLALGVLLFVLPQVTHAQRVGAGAYCSELGAIKDRGLERLTERSATVRARHEEQKANADKNKEERLAELASHRAEAASAREQRYETLRAQATNDTQAAAIETFVSTVEALVATRHTAIDEAIETFETLVEGLSTERNAEVTAYVDDFVAAIDSDFEAAQLSCDANLANPIVRNQLRDDLQATRGEYKVRREAYNYRAQVTEAREARKAARQVAMEAFRADFEVARETLRTALGV